jgi:hypothetical protein
MVAKSEIRYQNPQDRCFGTKRAVGLHFLSRIGDLDRARAIDPFTAPGSAETPSLDGHTQRSEVLPS